MNMYKEGYILGSTLRVKVAWSYPADSTKTMDNVDFVCKFIGRNTVTVTKEQMYHDTEEESWYAYIDTASIGVGAFRLDFIASIPDAHAPGGVKVDISRYLFPFPINA